MKDWIKPLHPTLFPSSLTHVLQLDQTQISKTHEALVVSIWWKERALPLMWKVVETKGEIGFDHQETLLRQVADLLPRESSFILMADRFYGHSSLIGLCQELGWNFRIRLKKNMIFEHEGGEITPEEAFELGLSSLEGARFHKTQVTINIGLLHEAGHPEPWFIAMDAKPNRASILDYGMRWGCEALFSDLKSRGFGVTQTHLTSDHRLSNLLLIVTIALYWACSVGSFSSFSGDQKKILDLSALSSNKDSEPSRQSSSLNSNTFSIPSRASISDAKSNFI